MPSSAHEIILLDALETRCRKNGLLVARPFRTKGALIDLLAYDPRLKISIVYEALTVIPTYNFLRDKVERYLKYGDVVFIFPFTFKNNIEKHITKDFTIEYIEQEQEIGGIEKSIKKIAKLMDALGDKIRLTILFLLAIKTRKFTELLFEMGETTGNFSYHLNMLINNGLINADNGNYDLTEEGKKIVELFYYFFDVPTQEIPPKPKPIKPKREMKMWKDEENSFIKDNYGKKTIREIAVALGRTQFSVIAKAILLGLLKKSQEWTGDEDNYLRENYGKVPMEELVANLGRSPSALYVRASNMHLTKR